jgi:hypothetical protein
MDNYLSKLKARKNREERKGITYEDVDRNLLKLEKGEPLDMPLALLDGKLKVKNYKQAGTIRRIHNVYTLRWQKKNKDKVRAYKRKYAKRKREEAKSAK